MKNRPSYYQRKAKRITCEATVGERTNHYMSNPTGYGRIKKENGEVTKIVEENETTELEKKINEVNTGIYCINSEELFNNIDKIKNENNKKEYYLTDIVEYIEGKKNTYTVSYNFKLRGINDYQTLKEIEGILNS